MPQSVKQYALPKEFPEVLGGPMEFDHLLRQTMGDHSLAGEILGMFSEQCWHCKNALEQDLGSDEVVQLAHQMKGCARAAGAVEIAQSSSLLEKNPSDRDELRTLATRCAHMCEFLDNLLISVQ